MRKTLLVSLSLMLCLSLVASLAIAKNVTADRSQSLRPHKDLGSNVSLDERTVEELMGNSRGLFSSAAAGTTVLASYTFDAGGGCDVQGWTSVDNTAQLGDFFHVDDFAGVPGYSAIEGLKSLWCGVPASSAIPWCAYATLPGYGNSWNQAFCTKNCLTVGNGVEISFLVKYDSEPGYDGTTVEIDQCDNNWVVVDGNGPAGYDFTGASTDTNGVLISIPWTTFVPDSLHGASMRVRLHFQSDGAWSDQDGLWNTNGAVIIDSLSVSDSTGIVVPVETFEDEAVGATVATDWTSCTPSGYGDFSGLFPGLSLIQEDPCFSNISCMWGFFNGSTVNYACGGFPSQLAMPYGNAAGQYLDNQVNSPIIPYTGTGANVVLTFDSYRDLPLDNLQFYVWHIRSFVGGCPGTWKDRNFVYYGGQKDWLVQTQQPVGDLITAGATDVQIALGAVDMCGFWCGVYGTGACHSHAPLLDNVNLYRIASVGPQWSARDIELFQDAFPADGSITGTAQANGAIDRLPSSNPSIRPADSVVVQASDPVNGLGTDATFGGPAVYCFVRCTDPAKTGNALPDTATAVVLSPRWPVVGTPTINGQTWTQIRMDTSYANGAPAPDEYCIDLNDNLFVPGDTTYFFFGAQNGIGEWSYWTRGLGTTNSLTDAATFAMEFTILPTGSSNILYVDGMDGRGAQPYFDTAFQALGINPDRYDIRGPSSGVANRPGSGLSTWPDNVVPAGVKNVANQVTSVYNTIIWNTGDLSIGLIGDGTGAPEKSDDATLLFLFLDQSDSLSGIKGVYFSGDDIAEEWASGTGLAGLNGLNLYNYITHTLTSGDHHAVTGNIAPLAVGVANGCFDHILGPDTLVAYGGCPLINDFDEITPTGTATTEMTYADNGAGAVISQTTVNPKGNTVKVILSGFSYHYIRDDRAAGIPDRTHHLDDILTCLNAAHSPATGVRPTGLVNSLSQNYPNPFNPQTTIRFTLKDNAPVSLKIYNVSGQLVKTLVSGTRTAGEHTVRWDGRNDAGQAVSSGVYFYKLVTKNFSQTRKMVLLK